ncbi:MAG: M20/M25/M40 family metallo-hydrolase [Acidimicrobiales bacterium]
MAIWERVDDVAGQLVTELADYLRQPSVSVTGGRMYARGAGDNKGQHFAHLEALRLLSDGGRTTLPCSVTMLLDGKEEVGSPNLASLVDEHRDLLGCDLVIWSDGPVHESGRWCVLFGVRGIVKFDLVATGAARTLHSGNWGGVAPNPLWTLVHLLATMQGPAGRITIDGFHDDVRPLSAAERQALERLPVAAVPGLATARSSLPSEAA